MVRTLESGFEKVDAKVGLRMKLFYQDNEWEALHWVIWNTPRSDIPVWYGGPDTALFVKTETFKLQILGSIINVNNKIVIRKELNDEHRKGLSMSEEIGNGIYTLKLISGPGMK